MEKHKTKLSWGISATICIHCDSLYLAKISFRDLLHFDENHRGYLLGEEGLDLTLVFNLHFGFGRVIHNLEGPVLHVRLHHRIVELAANQTFSILRKFIGKEFCK